MEDVLYPNALILPKKTTTERDLMIAEIGTIIYNTTTDKLNFCIDRSTGAESWEAVTSA